MLLMLLLNVVAKLELGLDDMILLLLLLLLIGQVEVAEGMIPLLILTTEMELKKLA